MIFSRSRAAQSALNDVDLVNATAASDHAYKKHLASLSSAGMKRLAFTVRERVTISDVMPWLIIAARFFQFAIPLLNDSIRLIHCSYSDRE